MLVHLDALRHIRVGAARFAVEHSPHFVPEPIASNFVESGR